MSSWKGSRLREAREGAGLSQLNVASALDVTQKTVDAWEQGKQVPSGQVLADLADFVGVGLTELFEAEEREGYRTHSKVSSSTYKEPGQAQEEAELAKLRGDVEAAEDSHVRALAAFRSADPWNRTAESDQLKAAGDHLAALHAKLKAWS